MFFYARDICTANVRAFRLQNSKLVELAIKPSKTGTPGKSLKIAQLILVIANGSVVEGLFSASLDRAAALFDALTELQ